MIPTTPRTESQLRKALFEAGKADAAIQAELDALEAVAVTADAAFGTDNVLVQTDGVLRKVDATTIATANVVTAASNFGAADQLIVSSGTAKAEQSVAILSANLVTATAAFVDTGKLIESATAGKGVQVTSVNTADVVVDADIANMVTAAAVFTTDNTVIRADGTVRGSQTSGVIIDDSASARFGDGTTLGFTLLVGDSAASGATISGDYNIFVGSLSGQNAVVADNNVAIGRQAMNTLIGAGSQNIGIGTLSLGLSTLTTSNIGLGINSLRGAIGTIDNTAIGARSFRGTTLKASAMSGNVGIGPNTGYYGTFDANNVLICNSAGSGAHLNNNNVGIGISALQGATAVNQNVFIGVTAGTNATMGSDNTGIGRNAGQSLASGTAAQNVFIGLNAGTNASQKTDAVNTVAIGQNAFSTADNQIVMGSSSHTATIIRGSITGYSTFDTAFVFNEPGADVDARFEGDTLTHMIFLDASAATENIAFVTTAAPNWQSMDRGLFVGDATTAPTGNPSAGIFLYSDTGELTVRNTTGAVSRLSATTRGATASVADGGTITHGLGTTPTGVLITGTVAGEIVSVTALGATTFTVAIKTVLVAPGTTQTIYWQAFV